MITGGCQCGAVRYRVTGELGHAGICHCRMCQKAFGSWGAPLVSVAIKDFEWTRGKPSEFHSSPPVARGFCSACGTPLYMHEQGHGVYELAIGTLDDPALAPPTKQVGIESRLGWFETLHSLPAKRTDEDRTADELARFTNLQHPDHDTGKWPSR